MRLLDRYFLRELLTPLGYCLGGFLVFWISYDLFGELGDFQEHKLHLWDVIEYYIAMTPGFLVLVLPVALLLALLYTLTNHARHNEITAARAAGVSLWRLCAPYFLVGLVASGALFALNELCAPPGLNWANNLKDRYVQNPGNPKERSVSRKFGFKNARAHRSWFIVEYDPKTLEMRQPQVDSSLPDGSIHRLYAERAVRTQGTWIFYNVKEGMQPRPTADFIPLLQTNVLAVPEFDETPEAIEREIKFSDYGSSLDPRKADVPLLEIYRHLQFNSGMSRAEKNWLLTDLHGRLAAPWTCLVVVLIAIPFGAASGRRNLLVGVAGSIFICFGYFVLQRVSLAMGSGGHWPGWLAAWLPNLVFGVMGLFLTARVT